jgi:branched-chain amino acid transport system substrate-binding protein
LRCNGIGVGPARERRGGRAGRACPVKIGGVLPLTGSMAPITKKIAQAAELAIEHVNQGGGVKGCPVQFVLRDDQGQPTVGVDAAKYLVEVERVPAFTGTISSGITGPIISSVTAPSKVVQITCCSTASPFTLDGRSAGISSARSRRARRRPMRPRRRPRSAA